MPLSHMSRSELEAQKAHLLSEIGNLADMRPGSLVERFIRCGKPGCRCAEEGAQGHGPFLSLTRKVEGKTVTWLVPAGAPRDVVRDQVEEYKRFRALEKDLIDVCERLSDARLEALGSPSANLAKKGASKKHSRRPSGKRSKPS